MEKFAPYSSDETMIREAGRVTGQESTAEMSADGIKLQASSLRDQALRVIRARIISGAMRPGELYALGATASDLGVSVTPVREAVLELARERLVELARNRGFRVREMTEHELNEIVEFRKIIEVGAVRLVAERKRKGRQVNERRGVDVNQKGRGISRGKTLSMNPLGTM